MPFCVRGLQMCAHETFMDCPHYEQALYAGDTRLHNLIAYTLCGDARLARRCIELFDWSRHAFGFTNSSYPASSAQLISTFPLYWVLMVRDYAWWREDANFVRACLPGVRANLDAFASLYAADGLVHGAPGWAFLDTVPEWLDTLFAPDGARGPSSTFNLLHALALQHAAELEEWAQEPELAARPAPPRHPHAAPARHLGGHGKASAVALRAMADKTADRGKAGTPTLGQAGATFVPAPESPQLFPWPEGISGI